jgi:glucose dehydrogenase
MSSRPPLTHILFMLLGYLAAALASAATVSVILALSRNTPPDLANASTITVLLDALDGFAAVSVFAAMFIAIFAFPVWLITAAFTEWCAIQRPSVYAFAGMLAAIPLLIAKSADEPNKLAFCLMGLFAGLVGGLVYWAITGRSSGNWKQLAPKELSA